MSQLCGRKGVKIIEAEICPEHVHMPVDCARQVIDIWQKYV